jgi:hypothetical protein
MSTVAFTSNAAAWRARVAAITVNIRPTLALEFAKFGEVVLEDSKANYCPIEEPATNNIRLVDTGKVDAPVFEPLGVSVRLSYGGNAHPYAIAVHEHLSALSPYSWRHAKNGVTFRVGGPKYLERPVMEHARDLPMIALTTLQLFTGSAVPR